LADVELRRVEKVYPGGVQAIHGIDIAIADGQLVVLVGPSGCGKSTLLRMVAGLEEITRGEIAIGGRVVNRLEPAERNIAMVFQNYALYPHMTVFDNMAYGLRNLRTPKPETQRRVAEAAGILGIGGLLERKPRQLSGGQRQRVAMGRAIVREPAVFLFDEPLSNLDAKLRVQMRLEIKRLQRRLGTTSLYVTHDQVEAMTLGDVLVVMNEGRAEQVGSPIEVYERPATLFAAAFIGSPAMNFLSGRITPDEAHVAIADGPVLPIPAGVGRGSADRPVTVGIRPEHLAGPEASGGTASDVAHFTMRVDLVETLGADTLVYGLVGSGTGADGGPVVTARMPGHDRYAVGEAVPLDVSLDQIHLFDPQTDRRLP
jgi:sn-glycerol 3-phosphate transport system ATP-binding protein